MINSWEVEQGVRSALQNRDAAREAGKGLGVLLPLAPVLLPAGYIGYLGFRETRGLAWHPMFSWIAAIVGALGAGMLVVVVLAIAGKKLAAVLGAVAGGGIGWIAVSVRTSDAVWAGGGAFFGALLGAGWFALLAGGCMLMLSAPLWRTPRTVSILMLDLVVVVFTLGVMLALYQPQYWATYEVIPGVEGGYVGEKALHYGGMLTVGLVGLGISVLLLRLVADRPGAGAALIFLQTIYLVPLTLQAARASVYASPPDGLGAGFLARTGSGAFVALAGVMIVLSVLCRFWSPRVTEVSVGD